MRLLHRISAKEDSGAFGINSHLVNAENVLPAEAQVISTFPTNSRDQLWQYRNLGHLRSRWKATERSRYSTDSSKSRVRSRPPSFQDQSRPFLTALHNHPGTGNPFSRRNGTLNNFDAYRAPPSHRIVTTV